MKIVTTRDHLTALCVDGRGLLVSGPGAEFRVGTATCPEWEQARPAAIVNIEHPAWVTIGFLLIAAGFTLQYFAVPDAQTVDDLRTQLRIKRKIEKVDQKLRAKSPN